MTQTHMRKLFILFCLIPLIVSCGGDTDGNTDVNTVTMKQLVTDVANGEGNKYIGKTINIDAHFFGKIRYNDHPCCAYLQLQTFNDNIQMIANTCDASYEIYKTYTFTLHIRGVEHLPDHPFISYNISSDVE